MAHTKDISKVKIDYRIKALNNRDAKHYALYCDELGINPEDQLLYEHGQVELKRKGSLLEKTTETESEIKKQSRHMHFLKEGASLNIRDYASHADSKSDLLKKYYPGKFGEGGIQPIKKHTDIEIGKIFRDMYEFYSRKYKSQS